MGDSVIMGGTWVDIVAPAPATEALAGGWYGALMALLVILVAAVVVLGNRPRPRARRKLRRVLRASLSQQRDARQACRRIVLCLREGFAQPQLSDVAFSARHQPDWQQFLMRLQHYCFAAQAPSPDQCRQAAIDALAWLARRGESR